MSDPRPNRNRGLDLPEYVVACFAAGALVAIAFKLSAIAASLAVLASPPIAG